MGTLLIYRYSLWSISWRTRRSRDFAALYIGWSTQNHCTGRTQCTAQWSKILKICPKSQFLSKTSKISFLYFFWVFEYNSSLCWNYFAALPIYWLVNTKPLHGSHPVHCTVVQIRRNLSKKSISIKTFFLHFFFLIWA